jgi:hypothetical protein
MKSVRLLAVGVVVTVIGVLTQVVGVGTAQAAVGDSTCTATIRISFAPPLTAGNTTANVSLAANLSSCTSVNGAFSRLNSGTVTATGTATSQGLSPCNLLLTIHARATFTWNTGETSRGDVTISTDPLHGGVGTAIVQVTSGPLVGDTGTHVAAIIPNVDCLLAGLRTLTAPAAVVSFN